MNKIVGIAAGVVSVAVVGVGGYILGHRGGLKKSINVMDDVVKEREVARMGKDRPALGSWRDAHNRVTEWSDNNDGLENK